jgi:hypothetical protein
MPGRMITEMVSYSVFWLNSFPALDGVSRTLSPRAIVVGSTISYDKHCRLEFGTYVQTHEEHDNSMMPRTTGAIALRPSGNAQGGYYFLSLSSGRVLHRNRWTELPMPADVIDRIHALARRSGADRLGIEFGNRDGNELPDGDGHSVTSDDSSYMPNSDWDDDQNNYDDDDDSDDDADDDDDDQGANPPTMLHTTQPHNYINNQPADADIANDPVNAIPIAGVVDDDTIVDVPPAGVADRNINNNEAPNNNEVNEDNININNPPDNTQNDEVEAEVMVENIHDRMNQLYGERTGTYNLRPSRPRDYSHLHTTMEDIVMTQHTLKKGIKAFGEAGIDAVLKELQQLHDRKVL